MKFGGFNASRARQGLPYESSAYQRADRSGQNNDGRKRQNLFHPIT